MNLNLSHRLRRAVCAVCAVSLLLIPAAPGALAAGASAGAQGQAAETLTGSEAARMAEADEAVGSLLGSEAYAAMSEAERQDAARARLDELAGEGLVQPGSIRYDEENGMYSFTYDCGVLGGILLRDWEDGAEELSLPDTPAWTPDTGLDAQNDVMPLGNAIIYYAFDDVVDSRRYPYYTIMRDSWNELGLATTIDSEVTLSDLKHMDDYDLCILSSHGAYYTYTTGWLFFEQVRTAPIIVLREESDLWKDLRYGADLLTHRVIKVNGYYCVTPDFFSAAYRGGRLNGTMIFSETCEFFGGSNILDLSMSAALLGGGASAVAGFVNNVYAIYSRSVLWAVVNQLIMGRSILQAVDAASAAYGSDDVAWYVSQGGSRPHRYASFVIVHGNDTAVLYDLSEGSAAA